MRLTKIFFQNKDTLTLAWDLLWKVITHKTSNWVISWIINEVEAYIQHDEASHTFWWKVTKKNRVMFEEWGHLYVYFTYWMYYCANIVSEKKWFWSWVLIRSIIPYIWEDLMIKNRKWEGKNNKLLSNWPAKFTIAFDISKNHNWIYLLDDKSDIYLEDIWFKTPKIKKSKRIWISKWIDKLWRFHF